MATIEKRLQKDGSVRWRVRVRKRGLPQLTETFSTKTKAQRWARKIETEIEEGRHFDADRKTTVAELIDRYAENDLGKLALSDQRMRARYLDFWRQSIGSYRAGESGALRVVIARELDGLLARGGKKGLGLSPASVNRHHSAMARVFSLAVKRWGVIEINPFVGLEKEREPQERVRYLSDEERGALLGTCQQSRAKSLYPFVMVALRTGARQGSIAKLEWRDVNLRELQIIFRETKNRKRLGSHIPPDLYEALTAWGRVRRIDSPLLFPNGFPRSAWERAIQEASVQDFRFHDLRHTFASYLAMAGADLLRIKEQLGHKTLAMVQKYAHLEPGHSDELIDRISENQRTQ